MMDSLDHECRQLATLLTQQQQCIVFAESCTAGLIAATLSRQPGISSLLAGSAVVYQIPTKAAWLGVSQELLENPGPVSQLVSEQMALGVLRTTEQATISASVTGHLGPDAPSELDGTAWSSVARRHNDELIVVESRLLQLDLPGGPWASPIAQRHGRQQQAVRQVLEFCTEIAGNLANADL